MALGLPSNILILVVSYMTLHKNPSSSCLLVNMAIAGIFISINISIKLKNELNENTNWVRCFCFLFYSGSFWKSLQALIEIAKGFVGYKL